jgi:hypothetical protein
VQVPEHGQNPAAGEDANRFLGSAVWIGPVPGLPEEHGVDLAGVQRELLGGAGSHVRLRYSGGEHSAHPVIRLNGDDVQSVSNENRREFSSPRSDIDDAPGTDRQHGFESGSWIRRTAALV